MTLKGDSRYLYIYFLSWSDSTEVLDYKHKDALKHIVVQTSISCDLSGLDSEWYHIIIIIFILLQAVIQTFQWR